MSTTITKIEARRFLVAGTIAVFGGKLANKSYSRVHTTLRMAKADAEHLDRTNAEALAYLAEIEANRVGRSQAFAAARAARADRVAAQSAFDF